MKISNHIVSVVLLAALFYPLTSSGYLPKETHPLINEKAVDESTLDNYVQRLSQETR